MGPITKRTLTLIRSASDHRGTLGRLTGVGLPSDGLVTLELPWLLNLRYISCIPTGKYNVVPYISPTRGFVYLLENVSGRTEVEIHTGNTIKDTKGCILVGSIQRNQKESDSYFIERSRDAFRILKSVVGDKQAWNLLIQNSRELEMREKGIISSE